MSEYIQSLSTCPHEQLMNAEETCDTPLLAHYEETLDLSIPLESSPSTSETLNLCSQFNSIPSCCSSLTEEAFSPLLLEWAEEAKEELILRREELIDSLNDFKLLDFSSETSEPDDLQDLISEQVEMMQKALDRDITEKINLCLPTLFNINQGILCQICPETWSPGILWNGKSDDLSQLLLSLSWSACSAIQENCLPLLELNEGLESSILKLEEMLACTILQNIPTYTGDTCDEYSSGNIDSLSGSLSTTFKSKMLSLEYYPHWNEEDEGKGCVELYEEPLGNFNLLFRSTIDTDSNCKSDCLSDSSLHLSFTSSSEALNPLVLTESTLLSEEELNISLLYTESDDAEDETDSSEDFSFYLAISHVELSIPLFILFIQYF